MKKPRVFSPALMPSRRHVLNRELIAPLEAKSLRVREVRVNSPEQQHWVEQASAHARFEALSPERWGHKRASKGGWEWKDLNDDDHQKWLDMREK